MSVRIITTDNFRREAKKLIKKYRSLKGELLELSKELEENPRKGIKIGEEVYKIRLAVKSKSRGKSGGLRVITYVEAIVQELDDKNIDLYLSKLERQQVHLLNTICQNILVNKIL